MNKDRVAVFVDWANARILIEKEIKNASATLQNLHFSYNDIDKLTYLFASFIVPKEERLFRIYLYDAEAMSSSELYNYAEKAVLQSSKKEDSKSCRNRIIFPPQIRMGEGHRKQLPIKPIRKAGHDSHQSTGISPQDNAP